MAVRPERKLTYDDYVGFPDDERWELIDGEALMVPAPNTRHQSLLGRIFGVIYNHIEQHGGGEAFMAPLDVVLSDYDVFQPDVVFIAERDVGVLKYRLQTDLYGEPIMLAHRDVAAALARRPGDRPPAAFPRVAAPLGWGLPSSS